MATYKDFQLWLGGLPTERKFGSTPTAFYVRPFRTASGQNSGLPTASDGNSGLTPEEPFKTVSQALSKVTSHAGQVIYMISGGTSAGNTTDDISSALTIDESGIALIGVNAGNQVSQRSRFNQLSTATGLAPMVTVSGSNNYIEGIQFFQGVDDATSKGNVNVTGDRNKFKNCHFAGIGHATMDVADAYSLQVTGEENVFEDCVIGLDTIARGTAANSELRLQGGATRNIFRNCLFITYAEAAGHQFVLVPTNGLDRWNLFQNCGFINMPTGDAAGTTMTEVFDVTGGGSPDGILVLDNRCYYVGASNWEADTASGKVVVTSPPANANTGGQAVDAS